MSVTITIVALVSFSFIAGELLQRLGQARGVILSGVEYVLIGALFGPLALGMITQDVLAVIEPAAWLLVGMVGFTKGLRLRQVVDNAATRVAAGLGYALLAMAGIAAAGGAVLLAMEPAMDLNRILLGSLVFGAAGSLSSTRLHRRAIEHLGARGPMVETLEVASFAGSALAVLVAGLTMDWQRALHSPALYDSLQMPSQLWMAMGILVGIVCGLLFVLFHRGEHDEERTFLATIGVVIFASGIAAALGSSPLLVLLITGVTVSIFSPQAAELSDRLLMLDRPLSIVLMLFAGAFFVPLSGLFWLLPLAYVLSRAVSLFLWPRVFLRPLAKGPHSGRIGAGLRSQGVIPVAIALSLALAHPEMAPVCDAILLGVLAFEFRAGGALRSLLGDAGELGRVDVKDEVAA